MTPLNFTTEQLAKISGKLGREVEDWLRNHTVEPHYTVEQLAELMGKVTERTIWNWVELGKTTNGDDGIFPIVKISHKVVLLPASSINRFLKAHTIAGPAQVEAQEVGT